MIPGPLSLLGNDTNASGEMLSSPSSLFDSIKCTELPIRSKTANSSAYTPFSLPHPPLLPKLPCSAQTFITLHFLPTYQIASNYLHSLQCISLPFCDRECSDFEHFLSFLAHSLCFLLLFVMLPVSPFNLRSVLLGPTGK